MSKPPYEKRLLKTGPCRVEWRDVEGVRRPIITGFAAVYDSLSEDLGGFFEVVKPGAFAKSLGATDVRGLFNHEPSYILGREKSRTLRLFDDPTGFRYEIDPPDTQVARDLITSIERGDIDGSSFGFVIVEERWSTVPDGSPLRELIEVHPFDVSPVTYPAYEGTASPDTAVALRSLDAHKARASVHVPFLDPAAYLALLNLDDAAD